LVITGGRRAMPGAGGRHVVVRHTAGDTLRVNSGYHATLVADADLNRLTNIAFQATLCGGAVHG